MIRRRGDPPRRAGCVRWLERLQWGSAYGSAGRAPCDDGLAMSAPAGRPDVFFLGVCWQRYLAAEPGADR